MKKLYLIATALAALVSCTSNDFVGNEDIGKANDITPMTFSFNMPAPTRGTATDADKLSNQFIVWGEKSEDANGAAATTNLVFKNYLVKYTANTAFTTTSNTENWEYVGITASANENTNIEPDAGNTAQTIKYWDYSASNYVFTAVSALPADIENGRVTITKVTSKADGNKVYDKGYTITLAKSTSGNTDTYPTLNKIYFSDRQVIEKSNGTDRTADNAYGGNVTLTFRNTISQVRAGVYETISGYDITNIKFYVGSNQTTEAKVGETSAFGAVCPNAKAANFEGTLNVTYYNAGTLLNRPKVTYTLKDGVTAATDLILGTNMSSLSTSNLLGTSATSPTWDTANGAFTEVMPQIDNTTNLKLKVDYTLYNNVSGETINVTGATAEIPGQYLAWKPNFKYTYLFKISENTNGSTGEDVTGLYPITFDALVVVAEDGTAEYITTVSEPSITTFGVKNGKYSVGKNEYETGTDIYATVVDNHAVVDPTDKYFVYTASSNDVNFPVTEASVAEAVAEKAIRNVTPVVTCTAYTTNVSLETTVPGEDGVNITLANSGKAIKMQNVTTVGNYVVAYKASEGSATGTTEDYDATKTYYSVTADTTTGFYPVATPSAEEIADWSNNKSKYTTSPTQPIYVYKVIKVVEP